LIIEHNDPAQDPIELPVTLTVTPPVEPTKLKVFLPMIKR
jgi:hypothetical protein